MYYLIVTMVFIAVVPMFPATVVNRKRRFARHGGKDYTLTVESMFGLANFRVSKQRFDDAFIGDEINVNLLQAVGVW